MNCFICLREIETKPEMHHKIPKRYYRKGNTDPTNLVPVHHDCHVTLHRGFDNPRWKLWQFKERMIPLNYGEGLLARHSSTGSTNGSDAMLAG